jgi:hypothetical protein
VQHKATSNDNNEIVIMKLDVIEDLIAEVTSESKQIDRQGAPIVGGWHYVK